MNIDDILSQVDHRPWNLPKTPWKIYQEWNNAIFMHWKVDNEVLSKFVPENLEIDLYNGIAWISIVVFSMENIRPKFFPAISQISNFDEVNVRTYVKHDGKPGVYFLSIEAGNKTSAYFAKILSGLPYRFSKIQRLSNQYKLQNKQYDDHLDFKFKILEKQIVKTDLEKWLTERYALFLNEKGLTKQFEVHHIEWPIQNIEIQNLKIEYNRYSKLFNKFPDICQYSSGVQVISWSKN